MSDRRFRVQGGPKALHLDARLGIKGGHGVRALFEKAL